METSYRLGYGDRAYSRGVQENARLNKLGFGKDKFQIIQGVLTL